MMQHCARLGPTRYRTRPGPGPALVCLHGIGADATGFDALIGHLPADWRVVSWHAPGYGGSDPLDPDWPQAADYTPRLAGLLDDLAISRALVLGHSLGTLIAAAFAARWPGRVEGLALLAPAQGYGIPPGAALPPQVAARIDDLARLGPTRLALDRAPRLLHRPEDHPGTLAAITASMARVTLPGYAQAARMLASGDLAGACARLTVPTTVLVGAEDRITPPDQARRAHAALPAPVRGPLHLMSGLGHALHQQDPAAVAAALTPFLQECLNVRR